MSIPVISADEAASFIKDGQTVAFSGFTPAGSAKVVPGAIAKLAQAAHADGKPFQLNALCGASNGDATDGVLARAGAIARRFPYQTNTDLRNAINAQTVHFADMHLSSYPQSLRYGFAGDIDIAILEACHVTDSGEITLTSSIGATPTFTTLAKKIIIELNAAHPASLHGIHDIYQPECPPNRKEIPIYRTQDRIGSPVIKVDPKKILGIVHTNIPDEAKDFRDADPISDQIGLNVAEFLVSQIKKGLLPANLLPFQSGVGNVANAVLGAMGQHKDIPQFIMYSEIAQDAVIALMQQERVLFTSCSALVVTQEMSKTIYKNLDFFKPRLVLRPEEITNHPEVVRRLGVISINTAIEADLFGNANSSHFFGSTLMNGIGGSGDFTRNAYLSIFICPSTAKNGTISALVPFCSHIDHTEHDTQIIVTEQGVADLRFKSPHERAQTIIQNCAHPDYKQLLTDFVSAQKKGHIPVSLSRAFSFHETYAKSGDMRLVGK